MDDVIKTYAAYLKKQTIRLESSSGGIFTVLADWCISKGGIVYGVAMSEDCYGAQFVRVDDKEGLSKIRGSKYIQAKVGNAFKLVRDDLDAGKYVLFTGTGCQVNGLRKFLMKDYPRLLCVDVVCHGTPSPKLWREYVLYQEEKYGGKMCYASFRNKERDKWDGFEMKEGYYGTEDVYLSRHTDPYFSFFVKNISLRPSCYNCVAKFVKLSDLTIADFWGIENIAPDLNDGYGISMVITRTEKGQGVFDSINGCLIFKEVSYDEAVRYNKSEYQSKECPPNREAFFADFKHVSFAELSKKYLYVPLWKKMGRKAKNILKNVKNLWGGGNAR